MTTTMICDDIMYDDKAGYFTRVDIIRAYGSTEDGTFHQRTWTIDIDFKTTNQSRTEAIARRRPNFCRVMHL